MQISIRSSVYHAEDEAKEKANANVSKRHQVLGKVLYTTQGVNTFTWSVNITGQKGNILVSEHFTPLKAFTDCVQQV